MSKKDNVYVPSSVLLEDIKKLTDVLSHVLEILEKSVDTDIYSIIKHVASTRNTKNSDSLNKISLIIKKQKIV